LQSLGRNCSHCLRLRDSRTEIEQGVVANGGEWKWLPVWSRSFHKMYHVWKIPHYNDLSLFILFFRTHTKIKASQTLDIQPFSGHFTPSDASRPRLTDSLQIPVSYLNITTTVTSRSSLQLHQHRDGLIFHSRTHFKQHSLSLHHSAKSFPPFFVVGTPFTKSLPDDASFQYKILWASVWFFLWIVHNSGIEASKRLSDCQRRWSFLITPLKIFFFFFFGSKSKLWRMQTLFLVSLFHLELPPEIVTAVIE
jgi:hypothetical protein